MRELLVDLEAVVVEGGGGLYIRFAGHDDDEDPRAVGAIGLWVTGRRLKLSIRQMLALPRERTLCDPAEARTRLTRSVYLETLWFRFSHGMYNFPVGG